MVNDSPLKAVSGYLPFCQSAIEIWLKFSFIGVLLYLHQYFVLKHKRRFTMRTTDNPQEIHGFLKRHARIYYCDDCLGKQTEINRHQINTITSTLSLFKKNLRESWRFARMDAATAKSS